MKKIIEGKVYNTETANCLLEWSNGFMPNDFRYMYESIYLSKKGTYFLYYEGGAMSDYAEQIGNNMSGSSNIKLITEEEAKKWALKHVSAEEYIDVFGEVEEG